MRKVLMLALAAVALTGCGPSKSADTQAAPAPKKYLSRSSMMYAGQEQILDVDSAAIAPGDTPDTLTMKATGKTRTPGYHELAFLPRVLPGPPADGIYDVDVVGYKPQPPAAQQVTAVEVKGDWTNYPKAHLKGVRFISGADDVVAMLPAG